MASPTWKVTGDYLETCSCDYLCPCLPSKLTGRMTDDRCTFAMAYLVREGHYGGVSLDGLAFAVIGHEPGPSMADGNMSVGVITDERATDEQREALVAIASGQAGGPMAALGPLVGDFRGAEARRIQFSQDGMRRSVSIPGVLDQALEAVPGADEDQPIWAENAVHPAGSRLALAKATRTHVHAFGIDLDETGGANNGHFAPFSWSAG